MVTAYLYLFLSILFYGLMGVVSKISEVKKCNPTASSGMLFLWAAALIFAYLLTFESAPFFAPMMVPGVALPFGLIAGIAFVALLLAIEYGKIATSWLVVSLSPIVPSIASVIIYHESLKARKIFSLLLISVSLFFLYGDKRSGEKDISNLNASEEKHRQTLRWLRLMAVVFFCASMGAFGFKVLEEANLSKQYRIQYLLYWYLAGFLIAAMILVVKKIKIRLREIVIGLFLGGSSVLANLFFSLALAQQVPGYIAFPVAGIGSILVVMTAGLAFFREELTPYGYIGVAVGLLALVFLGL
jgi:drug/metabolite transporter (DMT)-like permease